VTVAPPRTPTSSGRSGRRWDEVMAEHREALAGFLETASALPAEAWDQPWGPGKWTRAQVAEHLSLSYEAVIRELETGEAMALKLTPWRRTLTRWLLLPHILFHRSFPIRAPSPREIRPRDPRAPRAEALRQLRELGGRFEETMERAVQAGGGSVTHPFFGRVPPLKVVRFMGVHLEHHGRQIARGGK